MYYLIFVCIGIFDVILLTSCRHVIANIFASDDAVKAIIASHAHNRSSPVQRRISGFLQRSFAGLGETKDWGTGQSRSILSFCPAPVILVFRTTSDGPCIGLGCAAIIMTIYMQLTDWQKAVEDARDREE